MDSTANRHKGLPRTWSGGVTGIASMALGVFVFYPIAENLIICWSYGADAYADGLRVVSVKLDLLSNGQSIDAHVRSDLFLALYLCFGLGYATVRMADLGVSVARRRLQRKRSAGL